MIRTFSALVLSSLVLAAQQGSGLDEQILEKGDKLFEEAKAAYEDARTKSSVAAFVDAGFKLEEARIKFLVLQEIGSPEKQKIAGDRMRAINQLGKLIHDGKVAIAGTPAEMGQPPKPANTPASPASPDQPKAEAEPAKAAVDVSKRAVVPDAAKQREAEKLIKDLFKDQYAKKGASDRQALTKALLAQAAKTNDDSAALWVLYREAQDNASQAGDVRGAIRSVDLAASQFDVDALPMKQAALTAVARYIKTPAESADLAGVLLDLIDLLIAADQYESADKMNTLAIQAARKSNDSGLVGRATTRSKVVAEAKSRYQAMKGVLQTLAKTPEDPGANNEMGQFLCFVKGNWDLGLRFMARSSDAVLKQLAEKELAIPQASAEQVAIADGWYDLAEKEKSPLRKSQQQAHARALYELALANASSLVRAKIEKRLETLGTGAPTSGVAVDLMKFVDVKRDGVVGDWTCDGKTLTCNRVERFCHLMILYEPPDEYDLALTVERKEALDPIYVGLAKGTTQFYAAIDDWSGSFTALGFVDGKNPKDNETKVSGKVLTNDKPANILCSVRSNEVTVSVDGRRIVTYKGGYDRLSNMPELRVSNSRALFLGCGGARYSVTKLVLTPVSGQGKPLK